jgi:Uncharacterized protein conserved in bacteria (DUF2063).
MVKEKNQQQPQATETRSLSDLQKFMAASIMRPLAADWSTQKKWIDGRSMHAVASEYVKPGTTLTSLQRLEIYNQQYWYRLLDCFEEDFTGLAAILGRRKFNKLAKAYLTSHPSRSYSLRDLGCSLNSFLERNRELLSPHETLGLEMARFEWAQVIAFDERALPHLTDMQLAQADSLVMRLQPYITLLDLNYALDDYSIALQKSHAPRGEASAERKSCELKGKNVPLPKPNPTTLAVHRFENMLYYKRLDPRAFVLLSALGSGKTLGVACGDMLEWCRTNDASVDDLATNVKEWFGNWTRLGWLCQPEQ